jgi:hypothetical protein
MRTLLLTTSLLVPMLGFSAQANDLLEPRAEWNWRLGSDRSLMMGEMWFPFAQDADSVLYGDIRLMQDDNSNREFNFGAGYRDITQMDWGNGTSSKGVAGVNAWFDRRITDRGSRFHQLTFGGEWLGEVFDFRLNGYVPLSNEQEYIIPNANPRGPELAGTGIFVDTNGKIVEEPQYGVDFEAGYELGAFSETVKEYTDSFRVYGGGYYFDGDLTDEVAGWRGRIETDITPNIQLGTSFQDDNVRGSQGFLELTVRFPFDAKKSFRKQGLRARLDESPERDIDIVTNETVISSGERVPVLNTATGQIQKVIHVDNSKVAAGDGTKESPFNSLAAAEGTADAQDIIYVNAGTGDATNQNQGITLNQTGQQLIGSGINFLFDNSKFTTANNLTLNPNSLVIAPATTAPIIGNINAGQDGVTITADNITVAGLTVNNANTGRDGIVVRANGAGASAQNITIQNVTAQNNRMGVYIHGADNGAVSAKVQNTATTTNSQHGIAVYDDTNGTFEVDLGGGSMGSTGNNILAANTLEDLAIDYDGRALAAQNNWWGQATGPDTDTPDIGIRPQIYYGAPINDDLAIHLTFDNEWTTNTTAFDRSGQDNHGTLRGGLTLAGQIAGENGEGFIFDGNGEQVRITTNNGLVDRTQLTVLANFKDPTPDATLVSKVSTDYTLQVVSGRFRAMFVPEGIPINPSQNVVGNNVNNGQWNQIVSTWENGESSLYENGSFASSLNLAIETRIRSLGAYTDIGMYRFNAEACPAQCREFGSTPSIDDVRIYNRALTAPEISELYRMNTSSSVNTTNFLTAAP